MPTPGGVYRLLKRAFGPQGWWPVTPRGGGRPVYHPGIFPRWGERERFEIAVGAILTQNTAWGNVVLTLGNLHRARAVEPGRLAGLRPARLRALLRPSGYFAQKALKLQIFSREVLKRGGLGRWLGGPLDRVRAELLGVWGIGPETADSILLYALGRPAFVVDAYTRRAGDRLGLFAAGQDYEWVRSFFEDALPRESGLYQEYHALWVALSKHFCRGEPLCGGCPLNLECRMGRRKKHVL